MSILVNFEVELDPKGNVQDSSNDDWEQYNDNITF